MQIQVTIVGSGDALSSGSRRQTCIHVQSSQANFLVDCGPASLVGLKDCGLNPTDLDAILLTHAHGDHFGGVPFLLLDMMIERSPDKTLYILSPPHLQERVKQWNELCYPKLLNERLTYPVRYLPIETEPLFIPDTEIEVQPFPMKHQKSLLCLGYRIQFPEGKALAYTGDTEWNDNLTPLSANTDLFICECSYFTGPPLGIAHMAYEEIWKKKEWLPTQRLLLTHMGIDMLACRGESQFETSFDGLVLTL